MRHRDLDLTSGEHRLDRLLYCLLRMEADYVVSLVLISSQGTQRRKVPSRFSSRICATSICSGLGKHTALPQGTLYDGAAHHSAPTRNVLSHHDHVDRCPQVVKLLPEPRRLSRAVCDRWLDHEHIVVRRAARGASCS
jgi:hypothetical protein